MHFLHWPLQLHSSTPRALETYRRSLWSLLFLLDWRGAEEHTGGTGEERRIEKCQDVSLNAMLAVSQLPVRGTFFWTSFTHKFHLLLIKREIFTVFRPSPPSASSGFSLWSSQTSSTSFSPRRSASFLNGLWILSWKEPSWILQPDFALKSPEE